MREIEFRGKDLSGIMNHSWFYGSLDLSFNPEFPRIICKDRFDNTMYVEVDKETVGQYTGLKDKNGTKIFEGDIVKLSSELTLDDFDGFIGQVKFELGGFNIVNGYKGDSVFQDCRDIEVIGNIYDNPELTHQHEDKQLGDKLVWAS